MPENVMHFDGPCPFLACLEAGPHDHPICPDCGAVRYGNLTCNTCRRQANEAYGWDLPMLDTPPVPPLGACAIQAFLERLARANGTPPAEIGENDA